VQRILITGARAPVALELARHFAQAGFEVYVADSVAMNLCRLSNSIKQFIHLPAPATALEAYCDALTRMITLLKIELLVPTCEEIFYIAYLRANLPTTCQIFADDFSKLVGLHNKWQFQLLAKNSGVELPKTWLLQSQAELLAQAPHAKQRVFKPVFSRFAAFTLIKPRLSQLVKNITPTVTKPWLAQEYLEGQEYCSYSIAKQGKLMAHVSYKPTYRFGQGASIYFAAIAKPAILQFVSEFCARYQFTGQIGFDFIQTTKGTLYVLECNPRATSGIHLLAQNADFFKAFLGELERPILAFKAKPRMLGLLMLTRLIGQAFTRQKRIGLDYTRAKDVIYSPHDLKPFLLQPLLLLQGLGQALRHRTSVTAATTLDIEWNGEFHDN